jgi:glucose/arabinose dehydrogenase
MFNSAGQNTTVCCRASRGGHLSSSRYHQRDLTGSWSVVDSFADPYGVAVARDGTLYVADPGSKNVWKLTR